MLASERNRVLADLAALVRRHPALRRVLAGPGDASEKLRSARTADGGEGFVRAFGAFAARFLDVSYKGQRLGDRADTVLATTLELAGAELRRPTGVSKDQATCASAVLEERLLQAVGDSRRDEALEVLAIGRLSWRLRDDDNLLLGRIESQLLSALQLGADRLRGQGRLAGAAAGENASGVLVEALRNPDRHVVLPEPPAAMAVRAPLAKGEAARQLIGQPAAPGLATGRVRRIRTVDDLGRFRAGEVLVCDAIQPTMTHLVLLASAVVERRGGMLIHGAIVARELGIPCVNGIADAADVLGDGDLVTVDGHLGIVTVGEPEFDLERMGPRGTSVGADGELGEFTTTT
jgi:pyruvate,water dikinase